jgi:hypothetical protein
MSVHTHEIHLIAGREDVSEIRSRLFVFPEVLDVLAGSRPDSLIVVVAGRARPAEWSAHLRAAGYELLRVPSRPPAGASPDRPMTALRGDAVTPAGAWEPATGPPTARRRRARGPRLTPIRLSTME